MDTINFGVSLMLPFAVEYLMESMLFINLRMSLVICFIFDLGLEVLDSFSIYTKMQLSVSSFESKQSTVV